MSHVNTRFSQTQQIHMLQSTIVNYAQGGEAYTVSELNITTLLGVLLGQVSPVQNSLGVPLFPVLVGGAIKLFQFVSGSPVEIPTTSALNAVITALLWCN